MTINWEPIKITTLDKDEVFVFGSNAAGFHGAGAAGQAMRGSAVNDWRIDASFLTAIASPVGSRDRVGKWAVFGVASGFMSGREGHSYAVQTVTRPGAKRSVSRRDIYVQLIDLWTFARGRQATVWVTPLAESYAGYSREEMDVVWRYLIEKHGRPPVIRFVRP